jgi:hypothetical protein
MQRNLSIFDAKKLNRERALSDAWHLLAYTIINLIIKNI